MDLAIRVDSRSATLPLTTHSDSMGDLEERLLVQIGSYNTNLQGGAGLPQDLVDWLSPTLQVSSFLSKNPRAPDIVAIGFQELLPLHLGRAFYGLALVHSLNSPWPIKSLGSRTP